MPLCPSTHLEYPIADATRIDESLSDQMNFIIQLVTMGRSVRNKERIGVRQPLNKIIVVARKPEEGNAANRFQSHLLEELNIKELEVRNEADFLQYSLKPNFPVLGMRLGKSIKLLGPALGQLDAAKVNATLQEGGSIRVQLDGQDFDLSAGDLVVQPITPDNLAVVEEGGTVVALDTEITDSLYLEGLARDVVRKLQDLRKNQGLDMGDRINLTLQSTNADLLRAVDAHKTYIGTELLAKDVKLENPGEGAQDVEIRKGMDLQVRLS